MLKMKNNFEKKAVIVKNTDSGILKISSSGGAFYEIGKKFIQRGGYVCAAILNEKKEVVHMMTNDISELHKFCGSKYVQSNLGDILRDVKKKLDIGELVCFVGTPCQVAGLKSYLRTPYDNLFTMDFVCHGVSSPLLWEIYIDWLEKKYNAPIMSINFRSKKLGYHSSVMEIVFSNGKKYRRSPRTDFYLKAFFTDISSRESCYNCMFKGIERNSDMTLFDSWHPEKVSDNLKDDNQGYTNIIIHTKNGETILKNCENLYRYDVLLDKMLPEKGGMVLNSAKPSKHRDVFYNDVEELGIEKAIQKYIPITLKDYCIERCKLLLGKNNILQLLKNR